MTRIVDGVAVATEIKEFESCNMLRAEAGTTGPQGGDSGHGGRTYFSIRDIGSTDIQVRALSEMTRGGTGFEVKLGGDTELETIIDALKFIVRVLERESMKPEEGQ